MFFQLQSLELPLQTLASLRVKPLLAPSVMQAGVRARTENGNLIQSAWIPQLNRSLQCLEISDISIIYFKRNELS